MTTVRGVVRDVVRGIVRPSLRGGVRAVYVFNGTNMRAIFDPLTPLGVNWSLSLSHVPLIVDGTIRFIDGGSSLGLFISAAGNVAFTFLDVGGTPRTITGPAVVAGQRLDIARVATAIDTALIVNGAAIVVSFVAASVDQQAITTIAALSAPSNFSAGPIFNYLFTDSNPIQDTTINAGNDVVFGTVPAHVFPAGDEWRVSWKGIRHDRTGTGATNALSGNQGGTDSDTQFTIFDSGNAAPDRFRFRNGGGGNKDVNNAFADVGQGQHYSAQVNNLVGGWSFDVDGVQKGTALFEADETLIEFIGGSGNISGIGMAYQEFKFHNLTTGAFVEYRCNEVAGTLVIKAYDINGNETPLLDGAWPAENKVLITKNSRFLPVDEGEGPTLFDLTGGHDATIQNLNENNWVTLGSLPNLVDPNWDAADWQAAGLNTIVDTADGIAITFVNSTGENFTFLDDQMPSITIDPVDVFSGYRVRLEYKNTHNAGQIGLVGGGVPVTIPLLLQNDWTPILLTNNGTPNDHLSVTVPDPAPQTVEIRSIVVVNADLDLGPELWTDDPGFFGAGWSQDSPGVYSCDGTQASATSISMANADDTVIGTLYRTVYTVTNYGGVDGVLLEYGDDTTPAASANGTFVGFLQATVVGPFQAVETVGGDFIGTVSEISIREIL